MLDLQAAAAAASLLTVGALILRDLVKLGRHSKEYMTREEHERICEKRDVQSSQQLQRIEEKIDVNEENATKARRSIRENIGKMQLDVAILKDRMKVDSDG